MAWIESSELKNQATAENLFLDYQYVQKRPGIDFLAEHICFGNFGILAVWLETFLRFRPKS